MLFKNHSIKTNLQMNNDIFRRKTSLIKIKPRFTSIIFQHSKRNKNKNKLIWIYIVSLFFLI